MSDNWVTDGQTPGFQVQRTTEGATGGDFVRGRPLERQNALRFKVKAVPTVSSQKIAVQSSLVATAKDYTTVELSWGWPEKYSTWTEVAIVRSGFGHPSTVNDGVVVYRSTRSAFTDIDEDGAPVSIIVDDTGLQSGRWYYYTLFFQINAEWSPVMLAETLVPREFGHQDHLWNNIPPYYRYVDGRFRPDGGYLQQFLRIFGFELDLTREYAESWQDVYHTDFSPMPLLRRVGEQLGLNFEQGLGEIRYRGMVGQLSQLYSMRGTSTGLEQLIGASSQYENTISVGRNLMLLPDDSEFATGAGNWVVGTNGAEFFYMSTIDAVGTAFNASVATIPVDPVSGTRGTDGAVAKGFAYTPYILTTTEEHVVIEAPYNTSDKATNAGKGVMNVYGTAAHSTSEITIVCGLGRLQTLDMRTYRTLTPKYTGIAIEETALYGFSARIKTTATATVNMGIYWFDQDEIYLGKSETGTPATGAWQVALVQGTPTATSIYGVPYIRITGRTSGDAFKVMGCMFYRIGPTGSVTALSPDYYLTLGTDELIGESDRVIGG